MIRIGRPSFPAAHPWLTILAWVGLAGLSIAALIWKGIETDNSIDVFLVEGDPERERFEAFRREFGSNELYVVGQEDADLLTASGLERGRRLKEKILAADRDLLKARIVSRPVVAEVRALSDLAVVQDLVARGKASEVDALPLVPRTFLAQAPQGRPIGLIVVLIARGVTGKERAALSERITAAAATEPIPGGTWRFAGSPALNVALDQASRGQTKRLFPILFGVALLVLAVLTRSLRAALVLATTVVVALPITLAIYAAGFGLSLNMITTTIPAVLMVLAFAGSLHLYRAFAEEDRASVPNPLAADRARRHVLMPNLIAAGATAAGFASLVTSSLGPIRNLGITAAIGILLIWLVATTLLPAILSLGVVPRRRVDSTERPKAKDFRLLPPVPVLAAFAILAAAAAFGVPKLEIESAAIRFLPRSHPVVQDWDALQAAGFGLSPVELKVTGPASKILAIRGLLPLAQATEEAAAVPSVRRASSLLDALTYARRELELKVRGTPLEAAVSEGLLGADQLIDSSYSGPLRAGLAMAPLLPGILGFGPASPLWEKFPADDREAFRRFLSAYVRVNPESGEAALRIAVATASTEVSEVKRTLAALEPIRASLDMPGADSDALLTGLAPMLVRMQTYLIESQIWSLVSAVVLVMAILLLTLRSLRLALIGAIPNLLPILLMFGGLGWLGLKLDVATVMVGAIALGIAVDDTVHILSTYDPTQSRPLATRLALRGVLWPVLSTSLMSVLGFAVLGFSDFVPLMKFGLITAAAMVVASLCDLVLLPALLLKFGPRPDRAEFFRLAGAGGFLDRLLRRERGGRMLLQLATSACASGEGGAGESPRDAAKLFKEGLKHLQTWLGQNADPGASDARRRQRYAAALALKARCLQGLDRVAGEDSGAREWRIQSRRELAGFEEKWRAFPEPVVSALSVRLRAEMRDGDLEAARSTLATMQGLRPEDPQTIRGHLRVATAYLDRSKTKSGSEARADKQIGLSAYRTWVVTSRPLAPEPWVNLGRGLEALGDPAGAQDAYEKMLAWFETRAPTGQADLIYKVQRRLARLYLERGDSTAARDVYFRLLGAEAEANPWYQSPDLKTRIETIDAGRALIADTEELEL